MANCLLCYPNYADKATLTGAPWTEALPISNLQTRFLKQYARTSSCELFTPEPALPDAGQCSAAIDVDFGRLRYLTAVALVNHNLTRQALARFIIWTDGTKTTPKYDFGWQYVWPQWFDSLQLRWGDANFWSGRPTDEQVGTAHKIYLQMLNTGGFAANAISVRYTTLYLKDADNLDGYLQIGRLFMAEDWTPQRNMIYGATLAWVDPSVVDRALDGTKWYEKRTKYRQAVFQIKYMKPAEGVNKALMLEYNAGTTDDVLYIFDPANSQLMQQRSFVGNLSELSPLEWWMYGLTSMGFKLEESV